MIKKTWDVPAIESLDLNETLRDVMGTGEPDGLLESAANPVPAGWYLIS